MLPDEELYTVAAQIDLAEALADAREYAAGHDLLAAALEQAEQQQRQGCPWARDLVEHYSLAMRGYVLRYGVRLE
jgi:hypothetical protein